MSPDEKEIEAAALRLDPRSRARLAEKLLASLDALSEAEAEKLWVEEAERRNAQLDAGEEKPLEAADVLREARTKTR